MARTLVGGVAVCRPVEGCSPLSALSERSSSWRRWTRPSPFGIFPGEQKRPQSSTTWIKAGVRRNRKACSLPYFPHGLLCSQDSCVRPQRRCYPDSRTTPSVVHTLSEKNQLVTRSNRRGTTPRQRSSTPKFISHEAECCTFEGAKLRLGGEGAFAGELTSYYS